MQHNRTCRRSRKRFPRQFPLQVFATLKNAFHSVRANPTDSPAPRSYWLPGDPFKSIGCVTIDTLVIPDSFTASITLANAPNGTRWSLRK